MMQLVSLTIVSPEKRCELSGVRLEICTDGRYYSIFYGHEPQVLPLRQALATLYSELEEPTALFAEAEGVCLIERSRVVCILHRTA